MELEEFSKLLLNYSQKVKIGFNEKKIKQFYNYMNLLLEWNEKINLTAIIEPKDIILKHFIDSITINKYIKENSSLADIGTGAGFPGIPLKIIRPDLNITLVDSLNKRIKFLDEVISQLELKNVYTVHSRVEDFGKNKKYRESFDYVTARAVANLSVLSEYLIPLVKINGDCICMKGNEVNEEINSSKNAINVLGGKIVSIDDFKLADSEYYRNIIVINKYKNTPNIYPRKAGIPVKEPLK